MRVKSVFETTQISWTGPSMEGLQIQIACFLLLIDGRERRHILSTGPFSLRQAKGRTRTSWSRLCDSESLGAVILVFNAKKHACFDL